MNIDRKILLIEKYRAILRKEKFAAKDCVHVSIERKTPLTNVSLEEIIIFHSQTAPERQKRTI